MLHKQCKVCKRIISNEFNLRNHIELKHSNVTEDVLSNGTKQTYKCSFYGKYITTISNLRKHEQRKHAVQHSYVTEDVLSSRTKGNYKCALCDKAMSTISNLRRHERQKHVVQENL
ncbi:hypothetical protein DPMN_094813 [Dreissena polymorpha]|uniref:C2H2-type domain-containing protein n=1 Tax=Dreissena polymorpha TaxID=45954 RepID=A0A9D4L5Q9_DREPO|nr:hypothetical protein DPMN_094813 [Dreissena polymorpha]